MVNKQTDVLIIGGGLTGATLMLALQGLGYSTLLVETKSFHEKISPDFDARSLALSPASQRILTMLGVWESLQKHATAIEMIHVSDQYHFGASRLHGNKQDPLGYVIEMQYINQALHQVFPADQIMAPATLRALDLINKTATVMTESGDMSITAQLIVAADGAESTVRQLAGLSCHIKNYHQQALVANVGLIQPHGGRAYERFTSHGPLALLPMQNNKMSLVWAMTPHKAQHMMGLDDREFLRQLHIEFGYRLGKLAKIGTRFSYPLKQVLMPQQSKWPIVFVGNAAHTLHPVAGQGFNLGLRDVATLAQCIAQKGLSPEMLAHYLSLRRHDQQIMTHLTDGLIQIFTSTIPGMGVARSLGLIALDNNATLKNILTRYARGFGGVIPDLVCEMVLSNQESS